MSQCPPRPISPSLFGEAPKIRDCDISELDDFKEDREKLVRDIQSQVFDWSFDVFELEKKSRGHPLITMTMSLLEAFDLLDGWKLKRETVEKFLLVVEAGYKKENPYHNNTHAADVTQTSAVIMQSYVKHVSPVPKLEAFCVIMASAVHDLGHLGFTNDFLIKSKHERATTYNDRSVNENYHISKAFEIARTYKDCDIFELFTFEEQKKGRQLMIDMVLATDMAIHFDLLKTFVSCVEAKPNFAEWEDRNLIYRYVVHLADIANPARPFPLAKRWGRGVIYESLEQGDLEVKLGLPLTPMCDRSKVNMPKSQQTFIEVFVKPTLLAFENAAPEYVHLALEHLDSTVAGWKKLEADGVKT